MPKSNLQLEEERHFFKTIFQAGLEIGNQSEPKIIFQTVSNVIERFIGSSSVALYSMDPVSSSIELTQCCNWDSYKAEFKNSEDLPKTLFDGRPHLPKNQQTNPLLLPLTAEDRFIGMIGIGLPDDRSNFDDRKLEMLMQFAPLAAVNLKNFQTQQLKDMEQHNLTRVVHNLSILYDIGRALSRISDLKKLLRYILRQALTVAGAQRGSIMLYDTEAEILKLRIVEGLDDPALVERINNGAEQTRGFRPGEGVAGKVFQTGEPMIINDIDHDNRFVDKNRAHVQSIACLPMIIHKDVIGVINVTNKGAPFEENDVELLKAVADQAAVAINKAQLYELAATDSLTGLYVRRYFLARMNEEINRAKKAKKSFSILMVDLDRFKEINDELGHAAGDKLLQGIGRVLQENARENDLIARYGGDEFVMFLPETDKASAYTWAESLRKAIKDFRFDGEHSVTISVGISSFPDDSEITEKLLRKADKAMYTAKRKGRNQIALFDLPK